MYRFQNTEFFYAFAVVPLLVLLAMSWYMIRRRRLKKLADQHLLKQLNPYDSRRKRLAKLVLFLIGYSVLILAICNLQTGSKLSEVNREGADIIVCLDVSNSMLAQDLTPNRLGRAKFALEKMIDMLEGDRLGLVIFAGEAYVQLPITTDYSAAKMFLSSISPGMVPVQGTNLADAVKKASQSFSSDEGKNRAIILITDGENHAADAIEAADEAAQKGIMINTIGIGSENGVPIPLVENGVVKGYRKDREGQTVMTRLNSSLLKTIAQKAGGVYVQASQADLGLPSVLDKIAELDKTQIDSKMYTDYEDQFQWFVIFALAILVIEFIISERASAWYLRSNLFGNAKSR
jgi:Ca-activated chloride channel homolog